MPAANPNLGVFEGGQMTDLPAYPGGPDSTALMEVVSPGNVTNGVNYAITPTQLAVLMGVTIYNPTFVTSGASYSSTSSDSRILVNKTVGSPTTIALLAGSAYAQPLMVKDLKGDADVNPITITFPGTYDGASSPVTISTQYGAVWFNPLSTGNFYATPP